MQRSRTVPRLRAKRVAEPLTELGKLSALTRLDLRACGPCRRCESGSYNADTCEGGDISTAAMQVLAPRLGTLTALSVLWLRGTSSDWLRPLGVGVHLC